MADLPKISIEKLDRGPDYPTPYRAHIIGGHFDYHGEAAKPEQALLYAAQYWASVEDARAAKEAK